MSQGYQLGKERRIGLSASIPLWIYLDIEKEVRIRRTTLSQVVSERLQQSLAYRRIIEARETEEVKEVVRTDID